MVPARGGRRAREPTPVASETAVSLWRFPEKPRDEARVVPQFA